MRQIEKERADAEYSIGELAAEFDVTPRAIRFYEDEGLLAPRRDGQRRIYTPRERTRLKLTLRGKRLGLTLSEIRDLIDMYEPGRDERPQLRALPGRAGDAQGGARAPARGHRRPARRDRRLREARAQAAGRAQARLTFT